MSTYYEIHIQGHLDPHWAIWFQNMTLSHSTLSADETILSGWLVDQAQLLGILTRVHEMNLTLVQVTRLPVRDGVENRQVDPALAVNPAIEIAA